jgi:hypothetical protein
MYHLDSKDTLGAELKIGNTRARTQLLKFTRQEEL